MTVEEEFFKAFGIGKISKCSICMVDDCCYCQHSEDYIYPEITAEKLLELIDILRQHFNLYFWGKNTFDLREQNRGLNCYFRTGGTIKNAILQSYLCVIADEELNNEKLKQQVKELFEE